uniref:Uncharacterized protein n=1 Tax=Ditylenchus dipsaci TaxID=166011 RepID=A0A915EHB4_9BILA
MEDSDTNFSLATVEKKNLKKLPPAVGCCSKVRVAAVLSKFVLLELDEEMLVFASARQFNLLKNCTHIISDGTFKYAPLGTKQIYRVFGLIRGTHATPLVTALLKKKTKEVYKKMWMKVKESLSNLGSLILLDLQILTQKSPLIPLSKKFFQELQSSYALFMRNRDSTGR